MAVLKPLDGRNMVRREMLMALDKEIEDHDVSTEITEDIKTNEPVFDSYLEIRVKDHIDWLKKEHKMPENVEDIIGQCLYKFALLGFTAGKRTFSTAPQP